jgi:hypothetical protein
VVEIYSIIKADYLQRTRSYSFLITLAVTIYVAYLFVPPSDASYTTLNVVGYRGAYNSAWIGYVSAMMTTVMLSLYGFLLVNSGIKKDINTEVGLIIATTPITNFRYLLSKQLSNFLVFLTIACCTFLTSILLFFVRSGDYPFIIGDFLFPHLVFAVPALFVVASMAVVAEVFLVKRTILQFIVYFFICGIVMANLQRIEPNSATQSLDPFGLSLVTNSIKSTINSQFHDNVKQVSFGFIFSSHKAYKTFVWEGISWDVVFLLSRLLWIGFGLGLVYFSSFFFHRFDFKQAARKSKKSANTYDQQETVPLIPSGISRILMPPVVHDYSILPFIKTEFLLLIRKGNKWIWLILVGLWASMFFAPLDIAHTYILPVLWFLQVTRFSDLATKEKTDRVHYFSYASYKPLFRMLPAQMLAGIVLAVLLALPLMMRYLIILDGYAVINILNGSVLIVLSAICLGIISGGNKLYEVLFFLLTYSIVNKIPVADYLGSQSYDDPLGYVFIIGSLNVGLAVTSFLARSYQTKHV